MFFDAELSIIDMPKCRLLRYRIHAEAVLPASLLEGLGLELVPPDEVETRPELIDRLKQERDQR